LNFIDSAARGRQNSLTLTVGKFRRRSAIRRRRDGAASVTNLFWRFPIEEHPGDLAP
jgi:hypothetical protein